MDDTPTTASACQAHLRNTITAPRRERHTGQPEARLQGAGPLALRGGKREVSGSARTRVRNVEPGAGSKPGASIVSQLGRESTPSVMQGLDRPRRVGTARAGDVSPAAQAGRSSSVASPPVEAGRAARGRGRRPTNDHRGGAIAAPSPPGRHRDDVNRRSPRRAGSSGKAAVTPNRPRRAQSRLLLSAEAVA